MNYSKCRRVSHPTSLLDQSKPTKTEKYLAMSDVILFIITFNIKLPAHHKQLFDKSIQRMNKRYLIKRYAIIRVKRIYQHINISKWERKCILTSKKKGNYLQSF